jgi:hypothetical protein
VEKEKKGDSPSSTGKTVQFSKIPKILEQLCRYLDSPVSINMGKKKGRIDIEFSTLADLERIVGKIIG